MGMTAAIGQATAAAVTATRSSFGTLADGRPVAAVTLSSGNGVAVTVIAWGATLQSVILPDRDGRRADVALGPADMAGYLTQPAYFGATVGRFANRIAGGRFTLDGKVYATPVNDGPNALHGGTAGFDKQLWEIVAVTAGATGTVALRHVSPDGAMGYPGTLTVDAVYALDADGALTIDYRAVTDRPTIVNLTNHAYWNLAGEGSAGGAMGHVVTINGDCFTPVDATLIPTGELRSVAGTVFDFRSPRAVGERVRDARDPQIACGRGYDHNWVIGPVPVPEPQIMATVVDPESGRSLELWSNQPGLQFYSGNVLDGTVVGKSGRIYRAGDGLVLEPQLFPDTPNQPAFGSARLAPGETYRNVMIYRFGTGERSRGADGPAAG